VLQKKYNRTKSDPYSASFVPHYYSSFQLKVIIGDAALAAGNNGVTSQNRATYGV
jgi:hypothetical protein